MHDLYFEIHYPRTTYIRTLCALNTYILERIYTFSDESIFFFSLTGLSEPLLDNKIWTFLLR
jgi:hypothetical protein